MISVSDFRISVDGLQKFVPWLIPVPNDVVINQCRADVSFTFTPNANFRIAEDYQLFTDTDDFLDRMFRT